jgi:type IV secretion system protein VirD4
MRGVVVAKAKAALTLGLLGAAIVAGMFLSGWLTLLLLFGFKHQASLEFTTYWQYVRALSLPQVAPYAGRIRIAGAIGFGLPALLWLVLLYPVFKPRRRALHGDARFARRHDLARAGLLEDDPTGIVVGRFGGDLLRLGGARHLILAAPTRSGKTAGVAIPVLLTYQGSVVALDIKGELYATTSGWRARQGQRIFVWAPYAEDRRGHRFNPLQCVSAQPELRTSQIQSIGASLYPDDPDKDPFWVQQARNAFFGLASYMYERWDADVRTLLQAGVPRGGWPDPDASPRFPSFERLFRLSAGDGGELKPYLRGLMAQPFVGRDTRASLSSLVSQADETFASIIGSLQEPLAQFLNPLLAHATNACDFTLSDLRRRKTTVYVVVPPNKLAEARKLLNIFFSAVVGENTRKTPQEDPTLATPCLLLMDEFTSMGRVDILASSISHTAGYGLRSLPIIQSLSQLDATYGADVARTFITNHGASIVFTPREQRDAEEYSKMLGDTTVRTRHRSTSRGRGLNRGAGRNVSWNEAEERRPLMLPQEVKALDADKEIIFVEGVPHPILAEKIRYYRDGYFKKRLLPRIELPVIGNPNRQEPETTPVMIPRQMMRMLEQGQ